MTRYIFGGQAEQTVVAPDAGNGNALVVAPPGTVLTLFDAPGGTAQTDFLAWNAADGDYTTPTTTITVSAAGTPGAAGRGFRGPDGLVALYDAAGNALLARDRPGVPAGGTTGQVLRKSSDGDYATGWATPAATGPQTWADIEALSDFPDGLAALLALAPLAALAELIPVVVLQDVTTGFWPTAYDTDGTPAYTGGSGTSAKRPTAETRQVVFYGWTEPTNYQTTGANGPRRNLDRFIRRPAP